MRNVRLIRLATGVGDGVGGSGGREMQLTEFPGSFVHEGRGVIGGDGVNWYL